MLMIGYISVLKEFYMFSTKFDKNGKVIIGFLFISFYNKIILGNFINKRKMSCKSIYHFKTNLQKK